MAKWHGCLLALLMIIPRAQAAGWGAAVHLPSGAEWRDSASQALTDPGTWIPAALAGAVMLSGQDDAITRRVMETAPLFGNPINATHSSDELRRATNGLWLTSMLVTDAGDHPWSNRTKGVLAQFAAVDATLATSNLLKHNITRDQPDLYAPHSADDGFPSNHATQPFAQAALIRRNLQATGWSRPAQLVGTSAAYLLASGSAWARIEARNHHLSDQLGSAAVGNFVGLFVNDALMGNTRSSTQLTISPTDGGVMIDVTLRY